MGWKSEYPEGEDRHVWLTYESGERWNFASVVSDGSPRWKSGEEITRSDWKLYGFMYHETTGTKPSPPVIEEYEVWRDKPYGDGCYTVEATDGGYTYSVVVDRDGYMACGDGSSLGWHPTKGFRPARWYRHRPAPPRTA